jgi:hypothetical protein
MRYLVQLVIPALIFVGVLWMLTRQQRARAAPAEGSDTAAFVVILLVSGAVALGTAALIYSMAE